jgi:hypothetical protein
VPRHIGINVSARALLDRHEHCHRPIRRENAGTVPGYSCPPGQLEVRRRLLLRRGSVRKTSRTPIENHLKRATQLFRRLSYRRDPTGGHGIGEFAGENLKCFQPSEDC